jgi:hypothetical protein
MFLSIFTLFYSAFMVPIFCITGSVIFYINIIELDEIGRCLLCLLNILLPFLFCCQNMCFALVLNSSSTLFNIVRYGMSLFSQVMHVKWGKGCIKLKQGRQEKKNGDIR